MSEAAVLTEFLNARLGFGLVLRVGDDEVWGAQVNAASKLGEEMAHGGEILVTEEFQRVMPDQPFVTHGTLFGNQAVLRLRKT